MANIHTLALLLDITPSATSILYKLCIKYGPVWSFLTNLGLDWSIRFQNKRPDRLQSSPIFFGNRIQSSLEYKDQTV